MTAAFAVDPHVVGDWVRSRATTDARRVAILFEDRAMTYRELDEASSAMALALLARGLAPGDRVATLSENRPEHVVVLFACAKAGLVLFPMNWRLSDEELEAQLELVAPSIVMVSRAQRARHGNLATDLDATLGLEEALEDLRGSSGTVTLPRVHGSDALAIIATSGSTGRPKGAVLTHANFFWTNLGLDLVAPITREDTVLQLMPQFHVGGWNVQPLNAWWRGATVIIESAFDPERVLSLIERHRVTTMAGVPTTYQLLARAEGFASADLSSLRYVVVGGAAMPQTLLAQWHARGVAVMQGYGLTECAPNVFCLDAADAVAHPASVGHPYPYVEVALLDEPSDSFVEGSGRGELLVRGPSVFRGYFRDPEATRAASYGEWLRTGDVAERDHDGFYRIVGRTKEMYVSGGENVYPVEVENVLTAYGDVVSAAVVWTEHPTWGEAGVAFLEMRPGAALDVEDLRAYCRSRLAAFKVPVAFCQLDELPRTPVGKLDKAALRELIRAECAREESP